MTKVLALVDVQREYITPGRPFCIESIASSLARAREILAYARKNHWPIVHVRHLQAGAIFNPDSAFSAFVEGFEPQAGELLATKGNFSSYSSPEFAAFMKEHLPDEIVVAGYGSTMCCVSTIIDGYHRGQKFIFAEDASASKKSERFDEASRHAHACDLIATFAAVKKSQEIMNSVA